MLSTQELRTSTKKELIAELKTARKELISVRMGTKTKHLKDVSLASKQRQYVARIETILRELDLEEMVKEANKIN
jgi:ribosomal protein L29